MAICPQCGIAHDDADASCPGCGYPAEPSAGASQQEQQQPVQQEGQEPQPAQQPAVQQQPVQQESQAPQQPVQQQPGQQPQQPPVPQFGQPPVQPPFAGQGYQQPYGGQPPYGQAPQPFYDQQGYGAQPPQPPYGQPPYAQPPQGYQPYPAAASQATGDGILKMAWNDFKSSPGWIGRCLLLALINCVPILNFVATGYMLQWGRKAAYRTGDPMPSGIFAERAFTMGFFAFVVSLVWSVVLSVAAVVVLIPLVGLVYFVALAFAAAFLGLALMRMCMMDRLGGAFDLSNIWQMFRRNMGGAMAACWIPGLLACAVSLAVYLVMFLALGSSAFALATGDFAAVSLGLGGIAVTIVCYYVMGVAGVVASLVSYRALGYWIGRHAPEWVQESYAYGTQPR